MKLLHLVLFLALALPVSAAPLAVPSSEPVLVVSGDIGNVNVGDTAQFDMPMLEQMGMVTIRTKTPWHDGVVTFEGIRMDELMAAVDAKGEMVTATALNDYVTDIPIEDFEAFGVIMALKQDGEYMSVRDKGPLFIIYPFDDSPDLQSQTYFGRSAWQVTELVIK